MFKLIGVVACVAALGAGVGVAASAPGATAGAIVYHARLQRFVRAMLDDMLARPRPSSF